MRRKQSFVYRSQTMSLKNVKSSHHTVVRGVMKCPMPKCHCLSINYEIFILKWPFSASPKKISQWFSSMTLYAKWPHKPVDFNKIEQMNWRSFSFESPHKFLTVSHLIKSLASLLRSDISIQST